MITTEGQTIVGYRCDALANIKQQDVKLAELGLCEINYI